MTNLNNQHPQSPSSLLHAAIRELEVFIWSDASRLEIGEHGRLIAAKETRLERAISLTRNYLAPLISSQTRLKREKEFHLLKHAVLEARDTVLKHSSLIEEFKEGDDSQRQVAENILSIIKRYNLIVNQGKVENAKVYNYHRKRLLNDPEINKKSIDLPRNISIKYDSQSENNPAPKILQELSKTLKLDSTQKTYSAISSTHKKNTQFMLDTFRMKGLRLVQSHLKQRHSLSEIIQLIKQTEVLVQDDIHLPLIHMQQLLEFGPGAWVMLNASFKNNAQFEDSKFMTMPILDSFRLSSQITHDGFPYPSQHSGWGFSHDWINAEPLRKDQTPLFQSIEKQKKEFSEKYLQDINFFNKLRNLAKLKQKIFDEHREEFLLRHRQIHEFFYLKSDHSNLKDAKAIFDRFYEFVKNVQSPFDYLTKFQIKLLNLFIKNPSIYLEQEWLKNEYSPLRSQFSAEQLETARQLIDEQQFVAASTLDLTRIEDIFLNQQGLLLGKNFQAIKLQYLSEKIGFAPPFLNDVERQLQTMAFQQQLHFIKECDQLQLTNELNISKENLLCVWDEDLKFLEDSAEETHAQCLPIKVVNELEFYFNSRYYHHYPKKVLA